MINSYPSIYSLGHRYISELFSGPVVIQEKIDGSQFSFGNLNGKLFCRSKGQFYKQRLAEAATAIDGTDGKFCDPSN